MALEQGTPIGILTSGGDAPGMNAAVRAAARIGVALGYRMLGVEEGYVGLLEGRVSELNLGELDDSVRRGGTVLGTARSKVFPTEEGQKRARETLAQHKLGALLVIGGNGSLTGARTLIGTKTEQGELLVGGIPASIDNDLACTSMAIGVDTAMNTIMEAVDRLCDTATAHKRTFFIEVMGRDSGYLAMTSAVAAGADAVLIREVGKSEDEIVDQVVRTMEAAYKLAGKRRVLVVKAEGVKVESARLKEKVDAKIGRTLPDVDTRVTILGHVVRGGSPTAFDRLLGARLAHVAVRALSEGKSDFMAGWSGPGVGGTPSPHDPYVVLTPLGEVLSATEKLMSGQSDIAKWRRRIFQDIEHILAGTKVMRA